MSSCGASGRGSPQGVEEARELGRLLASTRIDLGVSSRLLRARETLEVALDGRGIPLAVAPLLDEISFGSFEGGTLEAYRAWAWAHDAGDPARVAVRRGSTQPCGSPRASIGCWSGPRR